VAGWLSHARGLRRLSTRALTEDLSESKIPRQVESLAAQKPDELTDYPRPLLEDREGNIWVSTSGGLDRFSYSKVVPLDIPSQPRSGDVLIGDTALVSDRRVPSGRASQPLLGSTARDS